MNEREQEIRVSLYADKMLKLKLDMIENNKLIAEFMELEATPKYNPKEYYVKEYNSGEWYLPEEMKYHDSWDWLMPVVQKIMDVSLFNGEPEDFYVVRGCIPEISDTYKAVVEFIKLYNKDES